MPATGVSAPGLSGSALSGWDGTHDGRAQGCDEGDRDPLLRRGSRAEKSRILDELCATTGWYRDHARKALRQALKPTVVRPRRRRPPVYGDEVIAALGVVWAVMDAPVGKRMAPFPPEIVNRLRACGEVKITEEVAGLLASMSAATIGQPDQRACQMVCGAPRGAVVSSGGERTPRLARRGLLIHPRSGLAPPAAWRPGPG